MGSTCNDEPLTRAGFWHQLGGFNARSERDGNGPGVIGIIRPGLPKEAEVDVTQCGQVDQRDGTYYEGDKVNAASVSVGREGCALFMTQVPQAKSRPHDAPQGEIRNCKLPEEGVWASVDHPG
jgi:hypothetical protein